MEDMFVDVYEKKKPIIVSRTNDDSVVALHVPGIVDSRFVISRSAARDLYQWLGDYLKDTETKDGIELEPAAEPRGED